jgi:hypothetical protein
MGIGDDQDQSRRADVPRLETCGSYLRLEVTDPRDHLDGDTRGTTYQQNVDRAEIAEPWDGRLERHTPCMTDAGQERVNVPRLCPISDSASDREELERES